MNISYRQINLSNHYNLCYQFRRDSYYCSFGHYDDFEGSIAGYKERIEQRLYDKKWHYLHIWNDQKIIGQLEFKSFSNRPDTGYVHLIYLLPEFRGLGLAGKAQNHLAKTLKEQDCKAAMLSVSRTNNRAIKHYTRTGWEYLAPNPKHELTDFYIRQLT